jgi:serine/threonine-protein kinase
LNAALSDRYRIERELGQGGMATVYLAEDLRHRRKVAIKVLRPELAAVIGAERFVREIQTIAALQHPHILGLIDSGEASGTAYYVMPFVEGESLRDRLNREKQLPIADAVRIATEVANALDYAHRHGVIHRDIKPENILLHDGQALVADFGIALAVSHAGGSRMTETGMSLGTPFYMSPEQAMGEREITARSDVYALGCVLYEMLTGEPPFTGATAQAIVARVMTEAPRSLTSQRHTIPAHVAAAVLTALEKLPADRFEGAKGFADALADPRFTAATTTRGTAVSAAAEARPDRRRLYALAGLSALLLAAAVAGWLRPAPRAAISRQRVILWQHAVGGFLSPGAERITTQAAIAPDGSSIVFSDRKNDSTPLMKKLRNETEARPLAGSEGGLSPFFSPDGKWIGYVTFDGRLRKVPVEGGGAITLATDGDATNPIGAWLDDWTIVYADQAQRLRRVSGDGGSSRPVRSDTTPERQSIGAIAPLPGSHGVLYTSCPGNCGIESSLYVFDFAADSGRQLVPGAAGGWYSPTGQLLYTDRAGGLFAVGFDLKNFKVTSGAIPIIDDVAPDEFTLSASGSALYSLNADVGAAAELVRVSFDGTAEPIDSTWRADFEYPALSPDGKALAVSVRDGPTQLWIWRSDGTRQKLTQTGSVNWRPFWTLDGRSVVFLSNLRGGESQDAYDIYQMRVDGSGPAQLLLHHSFGLWEAELSRDGEWLVFRSDEFGSDANIRARRLHGDTALVPLVTDKNTSTMITLSPDGHWLAYGSDATGRREIYVTAFPSASSTQLVSRGGGTEPRWSHSGRQLFFKSGGQMVAVDVTPGTTFVAGTPRPLFPLTGYRAARNRQQYDVTPDDKHFVMIRERSTDTPTNVVYVENWLEELKARVAGKH